MVIQQKGDGDMKMGVVLFLVVLISACVISREVYTSTGHLGHRIECSGNTLGWGQCLEKADKLCGEKRYEVLHSSDDQARISTDAGSGSSSMGGVVRIQHRNMIIECES